MSSAHPSKHPVTLELVRVALDPANPDALTCTRCGHDLEVHQPEAEVPDLLLGTCPDCGAWFAIGIDEDEASVCLLAGAELVRSVLASARMCGGGRHPS